MKWQYRRYGELSYLYSQYTIISSRMVAIKGRATDRVVMFNEKLLLDFKEKCGRSYFWGIEGNIACEPKNGKPKMKKCVMPLSRWSMPNTPARQSEMLCTTINIGGRWCDEHFWLNVSIFSNFIFIREPFWVFLRFKPWWTFIGFIFIKSKFCFSLLSNFWNMHYFSLFRLSFFLHSRAGELRYSVGRSGATVLFL